MKIGVVGSGALGCFYGGRLCRTGHDVHLLLRSSYEAVAKNGLRIQGPEGDLLVHPHAHDDPEDVGECDLVMVCLKTTANHQFTSLIPPLLNKDTAILCLQNGLGNCEELAESFGAQRIIGGLCFVCLNRTEPAIVHHIAFGKVVMGNFGRPAGKRIRAIAETFKEARIPCEVSDNLEQSQWEKLVWNIPFNGLGVVATAGLKALEGGEIPKDLSPVKPTNQLLNEPGWEEWVRGLMAEIITVANAKGLEVESGLAEQMINYTRDMAEYRASTLIDFERGQSLEMESMFLEPLRQAQATGTKTPRLEALCNILNKLNIDKCV